MDLRERSASLMALTGVLFRRRSAAIRS